MANKTNNYITMMFTCQKATFLNQYPYYLLCVFTFCVPCCDVRYDFCIETMFSSSLPPCLIYVICVYLRNGGIQHILCCVFACLRLVYPMLSVSLDCPYLIAPSVFSNV